MRKFNGVRQLATRTGGFRRLERDDAALPEDDQDNCQDQYHAGDLHEGANPAKTITGTLFEFIHKFNRSTNDPLSIDQSRRISHVQNLCREVKKPD
jgi:hypothetical protein